MYDSPVTQQQYRPQFQQMPIAQPPFHLSPTSPVVGFYTSTPQNIPMMQQTVNPIVDVNNMNIKLDKLTQTMNEICEKLSSVDKLAEKLSAFDKTVQNLVKTVENVTKRVDDMEKSMGFINEKFETNQNEVKEIQNKLKEISNDNDGTNEFIPFADRPR